MAQTLTLPSSCDLSDVGALRDSLLQLRGDDLLLDGGAVERIGALGLQVLASAERTWRADGHSFHLSACSERLRDALELSNLSLPEQIS